MLELLKRLLDERGTAIAAARSVIDAAESAKRSLTAEENTSVDTAFAAVDDIDKRIAQVRKAIEGEKLADEARSDLPGDPRPENKPETTPAQITEAAVRSFLRGETRSFHVKPERSLTMAEYRALSKLTAGAGANTVKISFYEQLMAHLIEVSGVLNAGPTILATSTGEAIQIPKTTQHSTAALIAEAAAITASDPTFGQVTLDAFKYAVLLQVSHELINDTSVDLLGYLAMECGRAVGNAAGAHFVTGTGAAQPNGVVTATAAGVTGGAGVAGAFAADNLIDLFYSVIAPYRNSPSAAWLMRDATVGAVRRLKGSDNNYLWQPGLTTNVPDLLLGKPVVTDPNVAAVALGAKSVLFGDFSRYFVRTVEGMRWERSDEFAFNQDMTTFRCIWRADGDLVDLTGAIKQFVGNAA